MVGERVFSRMETRVSVTFNLNNLQRESVDELTFAGERQMLKFDHSRSRVARKSTIFGAIIARVAASRATLLLATEKTTHLPMGVFSFHQLFGLDIHLNFFQRESAFVFTSYLRAQYTLIFINPGTARSKNLIKCPAKLAESHCAVRFRPICRNFPSRTEKNSLITRTKALLLFNGLSEK